MSSPQTGPPHFLLCGHAGLGRSAQKHAALLVLVAAERLVGTWSSIHLYSKSTGTSAGKCMKMQRQGFARHLRHSLHVARRMTIHKSKQHPLFHRPSHNIHLPDSRHHCKHVSCSPPVALFHKWGMGGGVGERQLRNDAQSKPVTRSQVPSMQPLFGHPDKRIMLRRRHSQRRSVPGKKRKHCVALSFKGGLDATVGADII